MVNAGFLEELKKLNAELEANEDMERKTRVVNEPSTDPRGPGLCPSPRHAHRVGSPIVSSLVGNNKRQKFGAASESESSLDMLFVRNEVNNFFVHDETKLVSFTTLPVYINEVPAWRDIPPEKVFVEGTVGPDRVTFKERAKMWRLIVHPIHRPQFLLKTEKGAWVRLLNPHENYTKIMNDHVHVLGHFLNFVRNRPDASRTEAEEYLQKMCRTHSSRPTLYTLSQHVEVIRTFIDEDDEFAKAPVLRKIISENSSPEKHDSDYEPYDLDYEPDTPGVKRKAGKVPLKSESIKKKEKVTIKKYVQKPKSLEVSTPERHYDSHRSRDHRVDPKAVDVGRSIFTQAEKDVEDPPICVLCDDGGDLLYCDGPCHRHFHHTEGSGEDSSCATLRLSAVEVEAKGRYYCPNCKHKQQQCFSCGKLGFSVATASGPPEVRCCEIPFCHKFFHVDCAAFAIMGSSSGRDWEDLSDAINDGKKKLYCPRHCCSVCGKAEMKEPGLLVQCRRCPKAWHRECLLNFSLSKELRSRQIWKHADRGFIYCRNHTVIPKLQTPARTHLIFPDV